MEWNEMTELLLKSIQIIGVFIAVILGLLISKVMELKKEKGGLTIHIIFSLSILLFAPPFGEKRMIISKKLRIIERANS